MSGYYWITIATRANDVEHARERARVAALQVDGRVVMVEVEPALATELRRPLDDEEEVEP